VENPPFLVDARKKNQAAASAADLFNGHPLRMTADISWRMDIPSI